MPFHPFNAWTYYMHRLLFIRQLSTRGVEEWAWKKWRGRQGNNLCHEFSIVLLEIWMYTVEATNL